jgi:glucose/arabinose dehydrogenase
MLPGAEYSDPELAWKFEVGPAGVGFLRSRELGAEYRRDLFLGGSRDLLEGGHLFRVELAAGRSRVAVEDERLEDLVADNVQKWDLTESESLLFGRNFGVATDIRTGPDGALYVVSLSKGAVYAVEPAPPA